MNIRAFQNGQICLSLDGRVHILTEQDCKRVIEELEGQIGQKGFIGKVKRTVSSAYDVSVANLESHARPAKFCLPRWICWLLLREKGLSFQAIGDEFGGRDHGTVMYGLNELNERIEMRKPLKAEIALLRERIGQTQK